MSAFDGLRGAARTAVELTGRARDPGFILNARRTLLPLPLVDRTVTPPRRVFPSARIRAVPALQGKRVAVAAAAGGGRTVALIGVAHAFEEAKLEPALMMERFDHPFALDVRGRGDVRGNDRLTAIEPFDDLMSSGMDLYDLFIDRRAWPDRMLSGHRAARDALTPFTRQPARRRSSGRKAAGS